MSIMTYALTCRKNEENLRVSRRLLCSMPNEACVERFFSIVKNVITNDRSSLSTDHCNMIAIARYITVSSS
ncbi:unnamed protein product, partial [Mesorhabditis spiculigera]